MKGHGQRVGATDRELGPRNWEMIECDMGVNGVEYTGVWYERKFID